MRTRLGRKPLPNETNMIQTLIFVLGRLRKIAYSPETTDYGIITILV